MCLDIETGESKMLYDGINQNRPSIVTADYIDRIFIVGE